jgi:peptidoglycan L-alanyl-D-glutamate endopeptidase CwlK
MEKRWVFHLSPEGEILVAARTAATDVEKASALPAPDAARIMKRLFPGGDRWGEPDRRRALADLADVAMPEARWLSDEALRTLALRRVGAHGQLVVVREEAHLPPCGSGPPPVVHPEIQPELPSTPVAAPAARATVAAPTTAATAPAAAPKRKPPRQPSNQSPKAHDSSGDWTGDSSRWSQEKKLQSMHPDLRPKVSAVIAALQKRGFQAKIFFAWRSVAVQLQIFKKGHTKVKFSFHNAQKKDGTPNAYAADIIDARYAWSAKAETEGFWKALGEEAHAQSLYWGGDWKTFRDWAHVQLVENSQLGRVKKESGL